MPGLYDILDSGLVVLDEATDDKQTLLPRSIVPPGSTTLADWFRCLAELQSTTDTIRDFYNLAIQAVTDVGGLDGAVLLMANEPLSSDDLTASTQFDSIPFDQRSGPESSGDEFAKTNLPPIRQELLHRAIAENATIYHSADQLNGQINESALATIVIAPIRNDTEGTTGFLCAWRTQTDTNQRFGIRQLEAHFVRMVAQIVSSTLLRHRKETEIAQKNALLAQAFPQKVVNQLRIDPTIFDGKETVVTTLFADLRGFSAISNRVPARQTYRLINAIMDLWTEFVIEASGAVVDYFGDGLVAFWNAPLEVENHAALAVQCAERIRGSLPDLSQQWQPIIGCRLNAGIGISTGLAHVGNCGSRHRFKYGPHGTNVNLASRLEKLTKELSIPIVISEETARQIEADYLSRRICKARISGFERSVNVYQPVGIESKFDISFLHDYEEVLQKFESGICCGIESEIQRLLKTGPDDPALQMLQQRVRESSTMTSKSNGDATTFLQGLVANQR